MRAAAVVAVGVVVAHNLFAELLAIVGLAYFARGNFAGLVHVFENAPGR